MSKAVLISIHPRFCDLIANGNKTVELRKTKPKLEPPFVCYIYCTDGFVLPDSMAFCRGWRMSVIGEFVCDRIDGFVPTERGVSFKRFFALHETALSIKEVKKYLNGKRGYGWHISQLTMYDTPKELPVFGLKRAPQSWCYVEKVGD